MIWRAIAVDLPRVLDALGVDRERSSQVDPDVLRRDLDTFIDPFTDDPYRR